MILDRREDVKGPFYRISLIERAALTLDNYAASEVGRRFYTEELLKGFSERRNEIHARFAKSSISTIIAATALTFFESLNGSITVFGVSFSIPAAGAAALCVLVALSLFGTLLTQIDQLIVDRYMNTLGNRIGMFSFELPLLNYSSLNLWSSALTPKAFGLASGKGHELAFTLFSILGLFLGFIFLAFPAVIVIFKSLEILAGNPETLERVLCYFAFFIVGLTVFVFFIFLLKYKFRPSGTSEPTDPWLPDDFLDLGHPRRESESAAATTPEDSET